MDSSIQPIAQESPRENLQKEKKSRFAWWQALMILAATLIVSLSAGYFISNKFIWSKTNTELEKQVDYYEAQVDQKPNDPDVRVQLGYSYFLKGDNESAIKQYKVAKNLDNKNYSAYLNLAIVYDKEKLNDDALQMAIKAAELAPKDYKSQLLKGRSYRKLKMYKEATAALQEAYRLKPGNTDVIYEAGLVAENQGKKKEAEEIFKEALSYDPTYKPALNALDRLDKKN